MKALEHWWESSTKALQSPLPWHVLAQPPCPVWTEALPTLASVDLSEWTARTRPPVLQNQHPPCCTTCPTDGPPIQRRGTALIYHHTKGLQVGCSRATSQHTWKHTECLKTSHHTEELTRMCAEKVLEWSDTQRLNRTAYTLPWAGLLFLAFCVFQLKNVNPSHCTWPILEPLCSTAWEFSSCFQLVRKACPIARGILSLLKSYYSHSNYYKTILNLTTSLN